MSNVTETAIEEKYGSHSQLTMRPGRAQPGGLDALLQGCPWLQPGPYRRRGMELPDARQFQSHAWGVLEREARERARGSLVLRILERRRCRQFLSGSGRQRGARHLRTDR